MHTQTLYYLGIGDNTMYWKGRNDLEEQVGTGIYFYHLSGRAII